MSKRILVNAAAAVAIVPVAAFSFVNAPATGARQHLAVTTPAVVRAVTAQEAGAPLQITRPGLLVAEPELEAAEVPDMRMQHAAAAGILVARWQQLRDEIAAARARARARARALAEAAEDAAKARQAAAVPFHAGVLAPAVQAASAVRAAPAASGSWQSITASLAGSSAGCLNGIIERESGGRVHASNAGSGAYGIPQALPGSKMASAGADWATNPVTQIRWMIGYINATYGSPCAAWAHERAAGTY